MRLSNEIGKVLSTWPILYPKEPQNVWISNEFTNAVVLHITKNQLNNAQVNTPLILAIQGGTGEGKSFQVKEICSRMKANVLSVSGAMLSGSYERESLDVLMSAYIYASHIKKTSKRPTVLLIDDFDLSVASTFEDRGYTVNSQLLSGFLMNLADDPTQCGQEKTYRIPIIVTGNNFHPLHAPLRRHGRMNIFEWQPSIEQKIRMVRSIFNFESTTDLQELDDLVKKYAQEPIAFFASLKNDVVDEAILQTINREGRINVNIISHVVENVLMSISVSMLKKVAKARHQVEIRDYLNYNEEL